MDSASIQAAADLIFHHFSNGTRLAQLPGSQKPMTFEQGYAIQALLEARSPLPLFGWKIAATSSAGQAHIAVDRPLAGRLFAEHVIPRGATCPFGVNQMQVAELEFAFRMGRTLSPRKAPFTVEEVTAAIDTLHPSIEIPNSRYEDFNHAGGPQLVADNACAHFFLLGDPAPDLWKDIDLSRHAVVGYVNGGVPHPGSGNAVLGDPRTALAWLANELSNQGIALDAGQVVTTGTCVVPMAIRPDDHVSGDFGVLGKVEIRMAGM